MSGAPNAGGRPTALLRIVQPVTDLAQSETFYRQAFGFERASGIVTGPASAWLDDGSRDPGARGLRLRLGRQEIELVEYAVRGRPYPEARTSADPWFQHIAMVAADIEAAYEHVRRQPGVAPISRDGPVLLPPGTGSVTAFKFRDPDGHPLELIHFPPGTGSPAWQHAGRCGCIGFDHTAIAVSDAAASISFYEQLGLREVSHSVNRGAEQADLDGLDHPVVDVVAMRPGAEPTPHLELLGYRSPAPAPGAVLALRPNDIACTRTVFAVDDIQAAVAGLRRAGVSVTTRPPPADPASVLLADPDGHHIVLAGRRSTGSRSG